MNISTSLNTQQNFLLQPAKLNDPFIDVIKGSAILMVVLLHSIPGTILYKIFASFWLSQAVPLFILVQAYHVKNSFVLKRRRLSYFYSSQTLFKIFRRILLPFFLLVSIQIVCLYFIGYLNWKKILEDGGIGPGSYYVYIYLQIAFFAPIIYYWMRNWSKKVRFLTFIILSESFELFCSYVMIPDHIYRLLFFRYFFLIYLGFEIELKTIKLNTLKIFLAVISIFFIIIDVYSDICLMPFIYGPAWKGCHWVAYFYTAYIFIYFLKSLYYRVSEKIRNILCFIGKHSYGIFLLQMFVFGINFYSLIDIPRNYFSFLLFFPIKIMLSILPVFIWEKLKIQLQRVLNKY